MRAPVELDVHVPVCLHMLGIVGTRIWPGVFGYRPYQWGGKRSGDFRASCWLELCPSFSSRKVLCVHCSGIVAAQQQLMGVHHPSVFAVKEFGAPIAALS